MEVLSARQVLAWAAVVGGTLAAAVAALLFLAPGMGFSGRPARGPGAAADRALKLAAPAPASGGLARGPGLASPGPAPAAVVTGGLSSDLTGPVPAGTGGGPVVRPVDRGTAPTGSEVTRERPVPSTGAGPVAAPVAAPAAPRPVVVPVTATPDDSSDDGQPVGERRGKAKHGREQDGPARGTPDTGSRRGVLGARRPVQPAQAFRASEETFHDPGSPAPSRSQATRNRIQNPGQHEAEQHEQHHRQT